MRAAVRWMIFRGRNRRTKATLYRDITALAESDDYDICDEWGDDTSASGFFSETLKNCYDYID